MEENQLKDNLETKHYLRKELPNVRISTKKGVSFEDMDPELFKSSSFVQKPLGGPVDLLIRFDNDYGGSLIRNPFSYGGDEGLYELAVIRFDGTDWNIICNTPVTDDVVGYATLPEVVEELKKIEKFKKGEF